MRMRALMTAANTTAAVALLCAACSSASAPASSRASTAQEPSTSTSATADVTSDSTRRVSTDAVPSGSGTTIQGTASPEARDDTGSVTATEPSAPTTDAVVPSEAAGMALPLNRFFNADTNEWTEDRQNVASRSSVRGISADVTTCGKDYGTRQLELRLEHRFTTLSFWAGQSNQSKSSTQKVVVEVLANNSQVDSRSIPFDAVQPFTIPVKDINAVTIRAYLDDSVTGCGQQGAKIVLADVIVK